MRRIIQRMVKIYRMWRIVRVAERELFNVPPPMEFSLTSSKCYSEFRKLRNIFGRHYTEVEATKAMFMADIFGYIKLKHDKKKDTYYIGISANGLKFSSISGLINELAGSVSNVPSVLSLLVSVAAIVVSIVALRHAVH